MDAGTAWLGMMCLVAISHMQLGKAASMNSDGRMAPSTGTGTIVQVRESPWSGFGNLMSEGAPSIHTPFVA